MSWIYTRVLLVLPHSPPEGVYEGHLSTLTFSWTAELLCHNHWVYMHLSNLIHPTLWQWPDFANVSWRLWLASTVLYKEKKGTDFEIDDWKIKWDQKQVCLYFNWHLNQVPPPSRQPLWMTKPLIYQNFTWVLLSKGSETLISLL